MLSAFFKSFEIGVGLLSKAFTFGLLCQPIYSSDGASPATVGIIKLYC